MNGSLIIFSRFPFLFLFLFPLHLKGYVGTDSISPPLLPKQGFYGFQLFNTGQVAEILSAVGTPSQDYIIGPKDKISIQILGRSQAEFVFNIEEDGFISPPANA